MKSNVLMKTLLATALATVSLNSLAHPPAKHYDNRYHNQQHQVKSRNYYKQPNKHYTAQQWRRGDYVPVVYHSPRYVVHNWKAYKLSAPPRGHQWLKVNGRFVQVNSHNHRIIRVL
ncbi:RcnB family protein [Alkanindiges sp. WGS2144]|uniref:RcnB family protein n=1 Tax=Alkanindiges sp. WGS2144 TaxID=3366808 RepID=UPI00375145C0